MLLNSGAISLLALVLLAVFWLMTGAGTAIREIRMALKAPEAIVVPEKGGWLAGCYIALIALMVFMMLTYAPSLGILPGKERSQYRALPKDGPVAYGLKCESSRLPHTARSIAAPAHMDGGTRLIWAIALPGDILDPWEWMDSGQRFGNLFTSAPRFICSILKRPSG